MSSKIETSGDYRAITLSNSVNFDECRAIYVGVGGDVVAVREDGTAITFKGAVTGTVLPIKAIRVNSTNTTATDLVALY